MRLFALLCLLAPASAAGVVEDVRVALAQGNLAMADSMIQRYRAQRGVTPELTEALSWIARGAFEMKQPDKAEGAARETETLVRQSLMGRSPDSDPHFAIALGASIEIQAQTLALRGERAEAVALLRKDLLAWNRTSIAPRIQKNINLLTLEGKPAPALEEQEHLGPAPVPLAALRGKPVLLFFWAHWCGDCKGDAPVIAQVRREYATRGLTVIAPTQRYGYVGGGDEANPAQELKYIEEVWRRYYPDLSDASVPVSEENFKRYGASTTPTLVLIDRRGFVRMYHPGAMKAEELRVAIASVL